VLLQIQPRNSRLHEMRAQVLDQVGRTFEAVQAAQQAVSLAPDWVDGHITLARVQLNLGEPQLALASYMAAAKLQPGHPDLAQEVPNAQMLAKMHQQQPRGMRAHVVDSSSDAAGVGVSKLDSPTAAEAAAAAAAAEAAGREAGGTGGADDAMVSPTAVEQAAAAAAAAAEQAAAVEQAAATGTAGEGVTGGQQAQQEGRAVSEQPLAAPAADNGMHVMSHGS
jgi:tetratricopeptide (TPR) repeat protein